jgi:hypothetical protein
MNITEGSLKKIISDPAGNLVSSHCNIGQLLLEIWEVMQHFFGSFSLSAASWYHYYFYYFYHSIIIRWINKYYSLGQYLFDNLSDTVFLIFVMMVFFTWYMSNLICNRDRFNVIWRIFFHYSSSFIVRIFIHDYHAPLALDLHQQ